MSTKLNIHLPVGAAHLRLPTKGEVALLIFAYCAAWLFRHLVYRPWSSPLKNLQKPPGGTSLGGHYAEVVDLYNHAKMDSWIASLGATFRVQGMFWAHHRLWTIDSRAVTHVLSKPYEYRKPDLLRALLCRYMKEGLIPAEGERHKVQRKVVQKLFSGGALRSYGGLVQEKVAQFRDILLDLTTNQDHSSPYAPLHPTPAPSSSGIPTAPPPSPAYPLPANSRKDQTREIDIYSAVSRMLFDLIGQIGIGHNFDSTGNWDGEGGHLFHNYDRMQQFVPGASGIRFEMSILFPWTDRWFPTENSRRVEAGMGPMEDLSRKRIKEVRQEMKEGKREEKGYPDLLTLMIRSTMNLTDSSDQKMQDKEITGQLATFMFAGTDTTANVMSFGLRLIAISPHIQTTLRTECLGYGDSLPYEQMDALPYLDAVVREMLRCFPSIPGTIREATEDDIIPLQHPIITLSGQTITSVPIRKGQIVHLPIENLNMAQSIWGPDAREFKPERWLVRGDPSNPSLVTGTAVPPSVGEGPGVWSNVMTFIDGPRRCVGYRLGIMEMKIMLYTLIREFEFGAVPGKKVYKTNMISTRPYVNGELKTKGYHLPLLIRPYKGDQ